MTANYVLGPWKDEPIDGTQDPELAKQKKLREEGVLAILKKKDLSDKIKDDEVLSNFIHISWACSE